MGKIRAVERTEVEQETEQAADAEPDPEGEHMIM